MRINLWKVKDWNEPRIAFFFIQPGVLLQKNEEIDSEATENVTDLILYQLLNDT